MEREAERAFQYHASLPYATETNGEALSQLDVIVARIEALYRAGAFNGEYVFGTAYNYEASRATRDLMVWMRHKLEPPLSTRVRLTQIYVDSCFEASEAALVIRYGLTACALWKSSAALKLLPEQKGLVDWNRMARAIKKIVLSRDSDFGGLNEHESPASVIMSMAVLFRCTVEVKWYGDEFFADILTYLGPLNDLFNTIVLSAFGALIPFEDPAAARYQRLLFSFWGIVPSEVATRGILPSVAQFAKISTLRGWAEPRLTDEQLKVCFQGTLHGLNIPLISLSKSKAKERNDESRRSRIKSDVIGLNSSAFAQLVVWSIRPDDLRALELLAVMVNTLQSFCHPSNLGPWTALIVTMLSDLSNTFIGRVNTEEELGVPLHNRLTPEIITRFVAILSEPMRLGVHSHSPIVFATSVNLCRVLATMSPDTVLPNLLGEVYPTLQHGLHQPHRIIASLTCISRAAVPLTATAKYRMHLTTLLELSLPSIDANEVRRCMLALALFQIVASLVMFEDRSDSNSVNVAAQVLPEVVHELELGNNPDLEPELYETIDRGTTAAFPEILTQYMRRVFDLLETTGEASLGSAAPASVMRVLLACSLENFEKLLQMTLVEVLNPQQQANDAFAQVCGAFVRANCNVAFPQFWSLLTRYIREEIEENQAGSGRSVMTRDRALLRYLSVLNMCLLAVNSDALVKVGEELKELLALLRERTGASVVYTVANTIHHAIAALVGYSAVLPPPFNLTRNETFDSDHASTDEIRDENKESASMVKTGYRNIIWNVPTQDSENLAAVLYEDQVNYSTKQVHNALMKGDSTVQTRDAVSSALIFVRTSTGAVAPLAKRDGVSDSRHKVAQFLLEIYPQLGRDDIASLKEILFVAKVWLCDVGYERTARIDSHQDSLYKYEKSAFKIPGSRKRYPAAVLTRRAQLYHHQRQSLATQRRDPTFIDKELVHKILVNACFSAYPAVRRNAFSALYSPLKIFADYDLYADVYREILDNIGLLIDSKAYDRAEGGFGLLTYRSMGMHTVCRDVSQLQRFLELVTTAIATDDFKLSNHAATVYWVLSGNCFRLTVSRDPTTTKAWEYIQSLTSSLSKFALGGQHWNQDLLRASSLMLLNQNSRLPIDAKVFNIFAEGIVSRSMHPDIRTVSIQGFLLMSQRILRFTLNGYNFEALKLVGPEDIARDAHRSTNSAEPEDDWSLFMSGLHVVQSKSPKALPRMRVSTPGVGKQGWLLQPEEGLWRVPAAGVGESRISESDLSQLKEAMSTNHVLFWDELAFVRRIEPRQEEDKLDKMIALVYRDLTVFASMGYAKSSSSERHPFFDIFRKFTLLNACKETLCDKNWHRAASEAVCGFLMALPLLNSAHAATVLDRVSEVLHAVLDVIAPETLDYWMTCMSLVLTSVDVRRVEPILTLLESSAQPDTSGNGGGIRLALRTSLYTEVLASVGWHKPRLEQVSELWPRWNHDLQATRETASNELAVAASGAVRRVWGSVGEAVEIANVVESGLGQSPITLNEKSVEQLSSCFKFEASKTDLSLLSLVRRGLQLVGPDSGSSLIPLGLEVLLRSTGVRDDPETIVLVTALYSTLDTAIFHPTALDRVATVLAERARSEQWHQRVRILLLIQSFFFNHLLIFSRDRRQMFASVAVKSLSDSQVEVRELAADTLSGIVRCSPPLEQEHYVRDLGRKFDRMLRRTASLVDRHAAVLGLGALVGAFPYVSPPPLWLPQVLATLAVKAAGDTGVVGKSTKQILGDFKKTRQDTWHIDQKAFTQDQLDDLDGVLWKNYFA